MSERTEPYVTALRVRALTPLYDAGAHLTTREVTVKRSLVAAVDLRPGQSVLDVGCGTGTLALRLKRHAPEAQVTGLDGDPTILDRDQAKIAQSGMVVHLVQGLATQMPFADGAFDHVVSSLVFHHLTTDQKVRAFAEIVRVLRPGGWLHLADWGKPQHPLLRVAILPVQLLDGFTTTADNVAGHLPQFMRDAGLTGVRVRRQFITPLGTLALYAAENANKRSLCLDHPSR